MHNPYFVVRTLTRLAVIALAAVISIALPLVCHAQASTATVTILHSFGDRSVANDGAYPNTSLIQSTDGNFYGLTFHGGSTAVPNPISSGWGTVYMMTPSGQITVLHSFKDGSVLNDGWSPGGPLVQGMDGNYYGTTAFGGSTVSIDSSGNGYGTAFKITSAGQVTILHSFNDGSVPNDGEEPNGLVMGADGDYYGTTYKGGSASVGTVFRMAPSGQITILHSFEDGSVADDGAWPFASLIQGADGNFYGTTWSGGSAGYGAGTVFQITPAGQMTILHSFGDGSVPNDGMAPVTGLIQATDRNFYGTTSGGGAIVSNNYPNGVGTVFKMTPSGNLTILHSFLDSSIASDGWNPQGSLLQGPDGNFYGTTAYGGSTIGQGQFGNGYGVVFQITPSGQMTILHSFRDGSVPNDGENPANRLIESADGSLNGTTLYGGSAGGGTIFKVTLTAPTSIDFQPGLQMFSVPYSYPGVNLDSILGYSGELAVWSPAANEYLLTPNAPADTIAPGQAYWARFPQPVSITLPGAPADTTQNFDIPLTKGWNMIGDPFTVSIPISSLLFNNGSETFAQATSGGAPLVGTLIYTFPAGATQYSTATTIAPEQGYWIYAFADTDVQVPHP